MGRLNRNHFQGIQGSKLPVDEGWGTPRSLVLTDIDFMDRRIKNRRKVKEEKFTVTRLRQNIPFCDLNTINPVFKFFWCPICDANVNNKNDILLAAVKEFELSFPATCIISEYFYSIHWTILIQKRRVHKKIPIPSNFHHSRRVRKKQAETPAQQSRQRGERNILNCRHWLPKIFSRIRFFYKQFPFMTSLRLSWAMQSLESGKQAHKKFFLPDNPMKKTWSGLIHGKVQSVLNRREPLHEVDISQDDC